MALLAFGKFLLLTPTVYPFYRDMKAKSKVYHGTHLVHCLQHVEETSLSGFWKYYRRMNLNVLQCYMAIRKMLRWSSGIPPRMLCSLAVMITLSRFGGLTQTMVINDYYCVQTLGESNNGHSSTVWAISFNAAGDKMVTCSDDLTVKIWRTDIARRQSGEGYVPWTHVCTLSDFHDRTIYSVHWSRYLESDGVIANGTGDDTIRLFVDSNSDSVDRPSYKLLLTKEKAHEVDINSVQWAPDKESRLLASASDDEMIKIWKLASEP